VQTPLRRRPSGQPRHHASGISSISSRGEVGFGNRGRKHNWSCCRGGRSAHDRQSGHRSVSAARTLDVAPP
jgi:hypothetical protein